MIKKRKARGADRRRESRYPLASRLSWRKAGNDKGLVGWLSDTSRSSVSFIASRRNQPSFGEMVEIHRQVQEAREYAESIVNTVREPLVVLDAELRVISANRSFYQTFGGTPEETRGRLLYDLGNREWDIPALRKLLEEILPQNTTMEGYEVQHEFAAIGRRIMLLNSRRVYREAHKTETILLAIEDITDRRRAERELAIRDKIAHVFLTVVDDEMYGDVLDVVLEELESEYGAFGYLDEDGALVVPSMTRGAWDKCKIPDKRIVFPRDTWGDSSWTTAIRRKETLLLNEPSTRTHLGRVPILRHICVPIVCRGEAIGVFQVANRKTDYDQQDIALLEMIGRTVAPVLHARLAHERQDQRRVMAEERLAQKAEELARANVELEQFVYTVSHDLKSPLVTIQGFAGHMAQDAEQERADRMPGFASRITEAVSHMGQIIDDLLDLSRIGRVANPHEPIAMTELIRDIAREHESALSESHVALEVEDNMPTISADRARVIQVFDNLLANALKHGRDAHEPRISIGARDEGNELRFFVQDNGPGIPAQYHDKIFGLFVRLQTSTQGTGVGLAIVKQAVGTLGGRVWVESEPGQGAIFWVALPKELVVAAE